MTSLRSWNLCTNTDVAPLHGTPQKEDPTIDPEADKWKMAAYHIDDAVHGRGTFGKAKASEFGSLRRRCFLLISCNPLRQSFLFVTILHSLLVFWEPTSTRISAGQTPPVVWVLHTLCLLLYIADVVVHFAFFGIAVFSSMKETRAIKAEFALVCMFVIDFVVLLVQHFIEKPLVAPFRCLRCAMFICKSKSTFYVFLIIIRVFVALAKLMIFFFIFILLFAGICVHVLSDDYHSFPFKNDTSVGPRPYTGSFDHVGIATLRVFGLLTTENYPEILLQHEETAARQIFFFASFIYIGNYMFLAILLAIIVDMHWRTAKAVVKEEREMERGALVKAWNIIDPDGLNKIPIESAAFPKVFREYNRKLTYNEISMILTYLDFDKDEEVHVLEWTIHLVDALGYKYIFDCDNAEPTDWPRWRMRIRQFLQTRFYTFFIFALILIFLLIFFIHYHDISPKVILGFQIVRSIVSVVFLIEFVLILLGKVQHELRKKQMIFQLILIITSALTTFLSFVSPGIRSYMVILATLAVLLRIPLQVSFAHAAADIFVACVPVMLTLFSILIVVFYFYGVLGLELFFAIRTPRAEEGVNVDNFGFLGCGMGFRSLECSLLIIFQILVTNDWHSIQNSIMTSMHSKWPSVFFISCFIMINYFLNNLLTAIAIEAYNKLGRNKEDEQTQEEEAEEEDDERAASPSERHMGGEHRHSLVAEIFRRNTGSASALQKPTAVMAFRSKEDGFINVHVGDTVEELLKRKDDLILARTSRNRTGWFRADCIDGLPSLQAPQKDEKAERESSSSSSRSIRKKRLSRLLQGAKKVPTRSRWRRQIVGDLTVMNPEEAIRLGLGNIPSPLIRSSVSLRDVPESVEQKKEEEEEDEEEQERQFSATFPSTSGDAPDWAQRFILERKLAEGILEPPEPPQPEAPVLARVRSLPTARRSRKKSARAELRDGGEQKAEEEVATVNYCLDPLEIKEEMVTAQQEVPKMSQQEVPEMAQPEVPQMTQEAPQMTQPEVPQVTQEVPQIVVVEAAPSNRSQSISEDSIADRKHRGSYLYPVKKKKRHSRRPSVSDLSLGNEPPSWAQRLLQSSSSASRPAPEPRDREAAPEPREPKREPSDTHTVVFSADSLM